MCCTLGAHTGCHGSCKPKVGQLGGPSTAFEDELKKRTATEAAKQRVQQWEASAQGQAQFVQEARCAALLRDYAANFDIRTDLGNCSHWAVTMVEIKHLLDIKFKGHFRDITVAG